MNDDTRNTQVEIIPPRQRSRAEAEENRDLPARRPKRKGSRRKAMLARVPGVPTMIGLGFYLMDDEAPIRHRLAIFLSLAWFVIPTDLFPDFLLPFGLVDDVAIISGLVTFLGSENLEPYRQKAKRWLRGEPIEPEEID